MTPRRANWRVGAYDARVVLNRTTAVQGASALLVLISSGVFGDPVRELPLGTLGPVPRSHAADGAPRPRPETPAERAERRRAWGEKWSSTMRDAWNRVNGG